MRRLSVFAVFAVFVIFIIWVQWRQSKHIPAAAGRDARQSTAPPK